MVNHYFINHCIFTHIDYFTFGDELFYNKEMILFGPSFKDVFKKEILKLKKETFSLYLKRGYNLNYAHFNY